MNKINSILIENFQSHKNTHISFHPGFNSITGPSDQGKSSILRAIKWALYNEPRGMEFIRHGASFAKVTIEMSSGFTIIRERSKNRNRYTVINPDGVPVVLEGFGNGVPEEVYKAHGMPRVFLDTGSEISLNLGEQLEGPFLLSQNAAVRARALGRLTGIHILDRAVKDCISDSRRMGLNSERLKDEIKDADKKLEEFSGLESVAEALDSQEAVIYHLDRLVGRLNEIVNVKLKYEKTDKEYLSCNAAVQGFKSLGGCEEALKITVSMLHTYNKLVLLEGELRYAVPAAENAKVLIEEASQVLKCIGIINDIEVKTELVKKMETTLGKLNGCNNEIIGVGRILSKGNKLNEGEAALGLAEDKVLLYNKLIAAAQKYEMIFKAANDEAKILTESEIKIQDTLERYEAVLKDTGICPFCGSSINNETIIEIINHYREVH